MTSDRNALEVRHLSVRFGAVQAVDDVSFEIRPGETLGLVGESGSGKTTIGRAVLGLAPASARQIVFEGQDITSGRDTHALSRRLQAVFQNPYGSLNPARTIGQTLAEPLIANERLSRAEIKARVREQLPRVGLNRTHADKYPVEFSGGQRQRIAVARALMLSPSLIVCDEPTSALDLSVQAMLLNLLRKLQREMSLSYLFISHDLSVVRYLCDRVVVLSGGRVMEVGETDEVCRNPRHPYTQTLLDAEPIPDTRAQREKRKIRATKASTGATAVTSRGACHYAGRSPYSVAACTEGRPPLRRAGLAAIACIRFPEWRAEMQLPEEV